jgi:hypothetical protein
MARLVRSRFSASNESITRAEFMKIGLFTEFSYTGKSEPQAYFEVLAQITVGDKLGYKFLLNDGEFREK